MALGACVAAGLCSKAVALPHTLQDVKGGKHPLTCGWGTVAPSRPSSPSALTLRGGQPPAEHVPDDTESATEGLRTQKHDAAGGEDALEEAERIMEMAKTRLEAKADKRKSDVCAPPAQQHVGVGVWLVNDDALDVGRWMCTSRSVERC